MAEISPPLLPPRPLRAVARSRHDGSVTGDYTQLPADLPVPVDDGAADGMVGREVPDELGLADLGLLVAYVYPMTGTPGRALPQGWDDIPGARGCTPQGCAYRDALAAFEELGATVVGISAQPAAEQAEFASREHIPFALLSDEGLCLREVLGLPTFEVDGSVLYRRLTFVAAEGRVVKAFYPVFPPDRDAAEVLAWLGGRVAEAEGA
ncbi:MAG: peroxiredoxin [Actinobacteria bacterium]|nr:peroxiredoxin [Actinomycetota bacterium]